MYNSKLSHLSPIINRIQSLNFVFIHYIFIRVVYLFPIPFLKLIRLLFTLILCILIIIYLYPFIINPIVMSILDNYDYMYSVLMSLPYVKSE